ncbi:MAG: ATPase [Anaerolineae bacterium]|nr:ATPase [Anaerolineae bacterium]
MTIYLGVDAGGTKTHALLADETGRAIALGGGGCGNWEGVGLDAAYRAWQRALDDARARAGVALEAINASAFGISGLDWPSDQPLMEGLADRLNLPPGPRVLVNDKFIALRAGTTRPWGVVVIAGTGSNKAGRNRAGAVAGTLGVGTDWGDGGGGMDITRAGLAAVAKAYIGMAPPTLLSETLPAFCGFSDAPSLLKAVTREDFIPWGATHLVFEAATAGDEPARKILRWAGHELAEPVVFIIRKLGMEDEDFELVLAGSVFKATEPLLVDTLLADVHAVAPKAKPVCLTAPPAVGGVLLAMEADGLTPGEAVRCRLIETAAALEKRTQSCEGEGEEGKKDF